MSTRPPSADDVLAAVPSPARIIVPRPTDTTFMKALARGAEGSMMLARKVPTGPAGAVEWQEFGSLDMAEIDTMFPPIVNTMLGDRDTFQTPNLFWRPGRGPSRYAPTLPRSLRKTDNVQWLNAWWSDIDCGRPGRPSEGQVLGAIFDAVDRGIIPLPAFLMRSGRGWWCFWLARNGNEDPRYAPDGPIHAWSENVKTWNRVQRAIFDRLAGLCADADSLDVVHVCRIPGSMNTRAGRRVGYVALLDTNGKVPAYTQREMCGFLSIPLRTLPDEIRAICSPEEEEARRLRAMPGSIGRYRLALAQFDAIRAMRGGFREGTRWRACRALAMFLTRSRRQHGMTDEAMRAEVLQVASECRTADGNASLPLPEDEAIDAWNKGRVRGPGNPRNVVIAAWLDVTPDESAQLPSWPAAPRFGDVPADPPPPGRAELRERRRELIRLCVTGRRTFPTLVQLAAALEPYGVTASPLTLLRDLAALGLDNPRGRAHRARQLTIGGADDPVPGITWEGVALTSDAREGGIGPGAGIPSPAAAPSGPPVPSSEGEREGTPPRGAGASGASLPGRVQLAVPLSGSEPVPVTVLEHQAQERERVEREAQRVEVERQREAEQRAADDLAARQVQLTDDRSPRSTAVASKPKPTTAERRAARRARELATQAAALEADLAQRQADRQAAMDRREAVFRREVDGARRTLEHLADLLSDRRSAAA